MNKSTNLIAGIALTTVSALTMANPVFPPVHLDTAAAFSGVTGEAVIRDSTPWYFVAQRKSRDALRNNEVASESPMPTEYYWMALRSSANDYAIALREYRSRGQQVSVDGIPLAENRIK